MPKSLIFVAALTVSSVAQAASSDYLLTIEGLSRPDAEGPIYLKVGSAGDLDGDGLADNAVLRISCSGGHPTSTDLYVVGPRDHATGQASGRRMHKPFGIVKEWSAASPQLMQMKTGYNVKANKAARQTAASDDWTPVVLSNAAGLCPAAEQAAKVTKSRSNIQNN